MTAPASELSYEERLQEQIVFLEAGSYDLLALSDTLRHCVETGAHLRILVEDGQLKWKAGEGTWSPPVRSHREKGGY
jgi:hypothetical protein